VARSIIDIYVVEREKQIAKRTLYPNKVQSYPLVALASPLVLLGSLPPLLGYCLMALLACFFLSYFFSEEMMFFSHNKSVNSIF
jgi:hypothetical protein